MVKLSNKEVSALRRDLAGRALGLIGRRISILDAAGGQLAYTQPGNRIHVSFDHEYYEGMSKHEIITMIGGLFYHEAMHQLLTDFTVYSGAIQKHPAMEQRIAQTILNNLEDAFIENYAPNYIDDFALEELDFQRVLVYKKTSEIQKATHPYAQFELALLHFSNAGLLKGHFTFPEAAEAFRKSVIPYNKAVEEPDPYKRTAFGEEIFEYSRPLWKKDMDMLQAIFDMLERLRGVMQICPMGGGEGGTPLVAVEAGENAQMSNLKRRRLYTQQKMEKEDKAAEDKGEQGEDGNESENGEVGDAQTPGSGKAQPSQGSKSNEDGADASGEKGESSDSSELDEDQSGNDAKQGTSAEDDNSSCEEDTQGAGDADDEKIDPNGQSPLEGTTCNGSDSADGESQKGATPDVEAGLNEDGCLSMQSDAEAEASLEEEMVITPEKAKAIEDAMESLIKSIEGESRAEATHAKDVDDLQITLSTEGYSKSYLGVQCVNYNVVLQNSHASLESAYDQIVGSISGYINSLSRELKRIFLNDLEDKLYRSSGRLNVNRLANGKLSTNVFEKKRLPANKSDMAVEIIIDRSGSMNGYKTTMASVASIGLAEVFERLNKELYVMGFDSRGHSTVNHWHYMRWRNTKKERLKLVNMSSGGGNMDGYSIRYATQILKRNSAEHKMLIVISDGMPSAYANDNTAVIDTKMAIKEASREAVVIGILLGDERNNAYASGVMKEMYGYNFLHVTNVAALFTELGSVIKRHIKGW